MVRLEDLTHEKIILQEKRFNSYMVRLEVGAMCSMLNADPVSIPIWCDWKCRTTPKNIPSESFNSYMVRLEVFDQYDVCRCP